MGYRFRTWPRSASRARWAGDMTARIAASVTECRTSASADRYQLHSRHDLPVGLELWPSPALPP
jgi:hypothetical protein